MGRTKSWEVSDALWCRVKPLIPRRKRDPNKDYKRKEGGGKKPLDSRRVFEGIVYALRTGCQWKAVPKEFGAASSIHQYFLEWAIAGLFRSMWAAGLTEYDELKGIDWDWQSMDGAMTKAPLARESVGRNPTDRGKNGGQTTRAHRRTRRSHRVGGHGS